MSELTREKIYKSELIKAGAEGNNNLARIRSLAGGGGAGVEYVDINTTDGGTFTQEEITKLFNGAWIRYNLSIYIGSHDGFYSTTPYFDDRFGICYFEVEVNWETREWTWEKRVISPLT